MDENKYQGRPCIHGHSGIRYRSNHACVDCSAAFLKTEQSKEYQRKWYRGKANNQNGRARTLLSSAKSRAAKKGYAMDLTVEWIEERLQRGVCELSGLPFNMEATGSFTSRSPTIDRRDASQGYTQDNCRLVLWALNTALGNWGEDELRSIVQAWLASSH